MDVSYRRIVTGHDAKGRSVVVDDSRVGETAPTNYDIWRTHLSKAGGTDALHNGATPFYAKPGEVFLRIVSLPPGSPPTDPAAVAAMQDGFFGGFGIEDCRVDTSRHPLMHATPTTDYIILLSGEMSLLLDEGDPIVLKPLDVVVQQATNHTWLITGDQPATFIAVMIGKGSEATTK